MSGEQSSSRSRARLAKRGVLATAAVLFGATVAPRALADSFVPGLSGRVTTPAGLSRGPGGELVGIAGDLLGAPPSPGRSGASSTIGTFVLGSSGSGDLRSTPGTAVLDTALGRLAGVARQTNGPQPRDPTSGAPLPVPAGAPGPNAAAYAAVLSRLTTPSPVNNLFAMICSTTIGFSQLDRTACAAASPPQPPVAPLLPALRLGVQLSPTAEQQALLGCGPFYGTSCGGSGIDLVNAEASAIVQSFPSVLSGGGGPQPGTIGYTGGSTCTRTTNGQTLVLPGCRGPGFDSGSYGGPSDYDPSVDGSVGSDPYLTSGHPLTGQAWASENAALSWNLLMLLVAASPDWDHQDFATASATQCSFRSPQLCTGVQTLLGLASTPLSDDPIATPVPRWLWETGAEYEVTEATGIFTGFVGSSLHVLGPYQTTGAHGGFDFLLVPVPEPGTLTLICVGLAALGAGRTRGPLTPP